MMGHMGRKMLRNRIGAGLAYAAAALAVCEAIRALLTGRALFRYEWAAALLLVPLLAVLGTGLLCGTLATMRARVQAARACLCALFALYMLVLLYLLFLSRYDSFWSDWEAYWNYSMVNFKPFSTIFRYLRAARRIPQIAATNLLGNLVLFMPMGAFLPLLFARMRTFWRFFLVMLAGLVLVEAVQLALRCGSCDVDDVLLNLAGAVAVYFAIRIPCAAGWLRRRYYLWTPEPASAAVRG